MNTAKTCNLTSNDHYSAILSDCRLEDTKAFSREAPQFDAITMIVLTIKERQGEQD